jgi:hypothetical protein
VSCAATGNREFAATVIATLPGPNVQRYMVLWRGGVIPKSEADISAIRRRSPVPGPCQRDIICHGQGPRRLHIDRDDARPRVDRANEDEVEQAGHDDVVDEPATPGDEALVFLAARRLADHGGGYRSRFHPEAQLLDRVSVTL